MNFAFKIKEEKYEVPEPKFSVAFTLVSGEWATSIEDHRKSIEEIIKIYAFNHFDIKVKDITVVYVGTGEMEDE